MHNIEKLKQGETYTFTGDVHIKGNVETDVTLIVNDGDLTIDGCVGDGSNILIKPACAIEVKPCDVFVRNPEKEIFKYINGKKTKCRDGYYENGCGERFSVIVSEEIYRDANKTWRPRSILHNSRSFKYPIISLKHKLIIAGHIGRVNIAAIQAKVFISNQNNTDNVHCLLLDADLALQNWSIIKAPVELVKNQGEGNAKLYGHNVGFGGQVVLSANKVEQDNRSTYKKGVAFFEKAIAATQQQSTPLLIQGSRR